jgi:ABC-type Fe3+-hydroxamate transport system substrate-binding protein
VRVVSASPLGVEIVRAFGGAAPVLVAGLAQAVALDPDVVLVDALSGPDVGRAAALRARGVDVIELSIHDFDDVFTLCRRLGFWLGREDEVEQWLRRLSLSLGAVSVASRGQTRPRVAAVVGLEPLEIAGGHSFATDLIELAGAESVSHGSADARLRVTPAELAALDPALLVYLSRAPLAPTQRAAVRSALPGLPAPVFLVFEPERVWLQDPAALARALRTHVAPLARPREVESGSGSPGRR